MDHVKTNKDLNQMCSHRLAHETDIVERFKCFALKGGCNGIRSIGIKFKIMDDGRDRQLDYEEFKAGVREILRTDKFTESELRKIFEKFDTDGSGTLNFNEFLLAVRPRMNKKRQDLVEKAFDKINVTSPNFEKKKQEQQHRQQQKLQRKREQRRMKSSGDDVQSHQGDRKDDSDSEADDVITVDDLMSSYDVRMHPKYMNGEWTQEQVLLEFLKNFEADKSVDGKVTLSEFLDYYSGVSASIDDDNYFALMMTNAWKFKVKSTD